MSLRRCLIATILWAFVQTQATISAAQGFTARSHFPGNFDTSGYVPDGRIINGTLATQNATKFQVSIRKKLTDGHIFGTGHLCGGSLIGADVVLCAAHCFVDQFINIGSFLPADEFIAVMGNLDRFEKDNNTLVFDVTKLVFALESFNLSTFEKDIALVFLNDSVPANHSTVQTIPYAGETAPDGTVCQVTGWGETEEGTYSDMLMTVDVPLINFTVCAADTDFASGLIKEGMLCAGYLDEGERDACEGDSGGPLVCSGIQNGIVSWGSGCAVPRLPGVYTDVAYWADWIQNQTGIAPSNNTNGGGNEGGGNEGGGNEGGGNEGGGNESGGDGGDDAAVSLQNSSWLLAVIFLTVTFFTN